MHNSTGPQSSNHNQPIHISSMIPLTSLTHPFSHLTKPQISPHPKTHYNIRPRSGDAQKMKKGNLTPKTITAPLAAFTMACILFAYTRSSIRSARDQATSSRPEPWTQQR
ncbi:uncharacterized protein BDZ83DRAFT_463381 [Colletotrichum acutatum]|uniref:Uncharacterized protein n=1 Tax=Glomerella acutata TaxID=27357 RepID=A0AAD8UHG8_GLOAC|nr:uncharacterized protein BDZ83DRAFT_463381 [Colletotrichum acutatum]KAK1719315.1 hypothetical protein BDZ83DRAFT_463381 [Colletotrichum acutatum]